MKFTKYLKERLGSLLLVTFAIGTIEIFLWIYQYDSFIKIYIPVCLFVTLTVTLLIQYNKKKCFYNTVLKNLETLDQKYLIQELIQTPNFQEGKILKEVLQDANKSMLEHVNLYKQIEEEYREYIELWIHEVKTPIATSKMIIENNQNEITQNIEEEIEKIDNYVEQALFYARSNQTEKDYMIKLVNLEEVIQKVMLRNKKVILDRKINLEIEEIEQEVYSDPKWLEFILHQIIANSIKYTKEKPTITIACQKQKNKVTLLLQDNGIGIAEKEIGRVFEKGFTGENGRKGNKSTGIGLYLCQKLCRKLGHGITLDSKQGKGTQVKIIFPIGELHNLTRM